MDKVIVEKIFCLADLQIETTEFWRDGGIKDKGIDRTDEFAQFVPQVIDEAKSSGSQIVVIAGDLFEYYKPNESSRILAARLVKGLAEVVDYVVITSGNHDLQLNGFNYYKKDGKKMPNFDAINTLVEQLDLPNVHYLEYTGFHTIDGVNDLTFAVWSHKDKVYGRNWNPWKTVEEDQYPSGTVIDIVHDTIEGAEDFKNHIKLSPKVRLNDFLGDAVIAGHIHLPQEFVTERGIPVAYCSSPVPRDFGEGNQHENTFMEDERLGKHGYQILDLTTMEFTFHALDLNYGWHTIKLTRPIDVGEVDLEADLFENNHISVKFGFKETYEYRKSLENHIRSQCNVVTYRTDTLSEGVIRDLYSAPVGRTLLQEIGKLTEYGFVVELVKKEVKALGLQEDQISKSLSIFQDAWNGSFKEFTSSEVKLLGFGCDNYRNLGKIDMDLEDGSIYRIFAANGVGKSTLTQIVPTAIFGKNMVHTKDNAKNQTALTFFNDKAEKDHTMVYAVYQDNDGEIYRLTRTYTREWKYSKPKYGQKGWEEFIRSVNVKLQLEKLADGNFEDTNLDSTSIEAKLEESFGSYDDYSFVYEVNSQNMNDVLFMSPERVIEYVLKRLGLDFIYDLNQHIKNSERDYKSDKTILKVNVRQHEKDIAEKQEEKVIIAESQNACDQEKAKLLASQKGYNDHINQLSSKKHQIPPKEELERSITEANARIVALNGEVDVLKKVDLAGYKAKIENLRTEIESLDAKLSAIKSRGDAAKSRIESLNSQISTKHEEIKRLEANIKDIELEFERTKRNQVQILEDKRKSILNRYKEREEALASTVRRDMEAFQDSYTRHLREYNSLTSDKERNTKRIADLQAGKCNFCGLSGMEIESISKSVAELQRGIQSLDKSISEAKQIADSFKYKVEAEKKRLESKSYIKDDLELDKITLEGKNAKAEIEKAKEAKMPDKQLDAIKSIQANIETLTKGIATIDAQKKEQDGIISGIRTEYAEANSTKKEKTVAFEAMKSKAPSEDNDGLIADKIEQIGTLKANIAQLEKDREKHVHNDKIGQQIIAVRKDLEKVDYELGIVEQAKSDNAKRAVEIDIEIKKLEKELSDFESQQKVLEVYKTMKKVTDSKNLPVAIFKVLASHINENMAEVMKDVDFTIYFRYEDIPIPELYFIDHSADNFSERPVRETSGMERTFAVLALKPNLIATSLSKMDMVVIDEITGGLDERHKLACVDLLWMLAKKIGKILLIDHYLDNDWFGEDLEIVNLEKDGVHAYIKEG